MQDEHVMSEDSGDKDQEMQHEPIPGTSDVPSTEADTVPCSEAGSDDEAMEATPVNILINMFASSG